MHLVHCLYSHNTLRFIMQCCGEWDWLVDSTFLLEHDSLALSTLRWSVIMPKASSKNWRLQILIAPLKLQPQGKSALRHNSDWDRRKQRHARLSFIRLTDLWTASVWIFVRIDTFVENIDKQWQSSWKEHWFILPSTWNLDFFPTFFEVLASISIQERC